MSETFGYDIGKVEKIPTKRTGKRGSKYDVILDEILESPHEKGKLEFTPDVEDNKVTYYRNQVKKRIDARNLQETVEVSAVGNIIYFEKK